MVVGWVRGVRESICIVGSGVYWMSESEAVTVRTYGKWGSQWSMYWWVRVRQSMYCGEWGWERERVMQGKGREGERRVPLYQHPKAANRILRDSWLVLWVISQPLQVGYSYQLPVYTQHLECLITVLPACTARPNQSCPIYCITVYLRGNHYITIQSTP